MESMKAVVLKGKAFDVFSQQRQGAMKIALYPDRNRAALKQRELAVAAPTGFLV